MDGDTKFKDTTLLDIQRFLEDRGISTKIKTDVVDSGNTMFYKDFIKIGNDDKHVIISPWNGGKKVFVPLNDPKKPSWYEKMVIDSEYQTDCFHVNTVRKMPKDSWHQYDGHVVFVYSFEQLEKDILEDFLGLKLEKVQASLFDFDFSDDHTPLEDVIGNAKSNQETRNVINKTLHSKEPIR